jgi:hypothetical protein
MVLAMLLAMVLAVWGRADEQADFMRFFGMTTAHMSA